MRRRRRIPLKRSLRAYIRLRFANGFWFPIVQNAIAFCYESYSLGNRFDNWLRAGSHYIRGATEIYQFGLAVASLLWAALITQPALLLLTIPTIRALGVVIALYFISELLVFSLHWIFVAKGALHSRQRALAGFLVNMLSEVPALFIVLFALFGCQEPIPSFSSAYQNHIGSIFKLEIASVNDNWGCQPLAQYEIIVAATLLIIVVASLVGAIVRPEKTDATK